MEAKRQAILVAGPHRSGTSAITRVLNLLGADLSEELIPASRGNELGHWESARAVELHREMLRSAGSRWYNVGGIDPDWFQSADAERYCKAIAEFVESDFSKTSVFVVKDPRLALFIPVWRAALSELGIEPRFVLPFRHPVEAGSSLAAREAHFQPEGLWPIERGTLLWLRYVLAAEKATRGQPRSFVCFDAVLDNWEREFERIAGQLGMLWPRQDGTTKSEINSFLNRERKHENVSAEEDTRLARLSPWLDRVLEQLTACVGDPQSGGDLFDEAMRTLDEATQLFGDYPMAVAIRRLDERHRALAVSMEAEQRVKAATIEELRRSNEALNIALSQEIQAGIAREERIEALLSSTSWRITAPIRKLKGLYG